MKISNKHIEYILPQQMLICMISVETHKIKNFYKGV